MEEVAEVVEAAVEEEDVATHCLFEAVVALVARTRGLKAILLEDGGNEGAEVCNEEEEQDERQCNAGQRQSCTV